MKKIILADAPMGACVLVDGRWGVKCTGRALSCIVDFWDGGREWVRGWKVVEI